MTSPKVNVVQVTHVGAPDPKRVSETLRHVEEWMLMRGMPVEGDDGLMSTRRMVEDEQEPELVEADVDL